MKEMKWERVNQPQTLSQKTSNTSKFYEFTLFLLGLVASEEIFAQILVN